MKQVNPKVNASVLSELGKNYRDLQSSVIKTISEIKLDDNTDLNFIGEAFKICKEQIVCELKKK